MKAIVCDRCGDTQLEPRINIMKVTLSTETGMQKTCELCVKCKDTLFRYLGKGEIIKIDKQ